MLLLFHAGHAGAIGALSLFQSHMLLFHILRLSSMIVFFKHGLGFDGLELSLEIGDVVAVGAAIRATTGIGELIAIVLALLSWRSPITLPSSFLLHFLRVSINMTGLCEVTRKMILRDGSAVGKSDMITVVLLVRASHLRKVWVNTSLERIV